MQIYFACPTGKRRDGLVKNYGTKFGACLTRDNFNNVTANMMPWFFDNGAYTDWQRNLIFNSQKFYDRLMEIELKVRQGALLHPDFVVIPDIVAKGFESLERSLKWVEFLNETFPHHNYYLAVQDGMNFKHIEILMKRKLFDGIFVGGTKPWKYKHGEGIVQMAHKYGLPVHCGAIGTRKNILWAKMAGFDSVDSGVAMIHPGHLKDVLNMEQELLWSA